MSIRIGIDIDGVLARFDGKFAKLLVEESGEDKINGALDVDHPPTWDWPEYYGYHPQHIRAAWRRVENSGDFWTTLPALTNAKVLAESMPWAVHAVYFITNRPGYNPKQQTERWLRENLKIEVPTVLISARKGTSAAALELDVYVDDKGENILDVERESPKTRAYLIDRPYNEHVKVQRRVSGLKSVFELEKL
jgi:hypothetical protein